MKFNRRLSQVKAISFDLDDTLYSNKPIMEAIEKKMIAYFAGLNVVSVQGSDESQLLDYKFWSAFRRQAVMHQPDLAHDVVKVRLVTYRLGFISLGCTQNEAEKEAQAALDYFISLRSDFAVPESSLNLLKTLSKQYPLIAISNGNVDTQTLGISQYFQHIFHAGWQSDGKLLKQKPSGDMFSVACQNLSIKPSELLHVGDCGRADIQGALRAGCQAAWLSIYDVGKPISVLPHLELSSLNQLELI